MAKFLAMPQMRLQVRLQPAAAAQPLFHAPCRRSAPISSSIDLRSFHSQVQLDLRPRWTPVTRARPFPVVVVDLRAIRTRQQSTSSGSGQARRPPPPPPRPGKLAFIGLLFRAIGGTLKSLFMPFQGHTLRTLFRQSPEELVIALVVLVISVGVLAYIFTIYFTYFYSRQFTRYPPPVAKYLRRALYFSNYSPDPKRALKNYRLALEQCDELGLDPLSDDVLGIRIQLAAWLEKIENYDTAIRILELLLGDCQRWVQKMEASVKDGTAKDDGTLSSRLPPRAKSKDGDDVETQAEADRENLWARRSRLLQKAIGISVKLGELYSDEHVLKAEQAHDRLVWSVNTALEEFRRRSQEGVKPGEGSWMNPKEMGGALESLANSYEAQSQHHLALPLYFQALRLCNDPCHSAVIMNNLSASFVQHPINAEYQSLLDTLLEEPQKAKTNKPPTTEEARSAFLLAGQRWALNAHHHAKDTVGDARTDECDTACAVALCNLGDISSMLGNFDEARRRYKQAVP